MSEALKKLFCAGGLACVCFFALSADAQDVFKQGSQEYLARHYQVSAKLFAELAAAAPASGTFHNLGDAEWQCGQTGPAILAWERAGWINPFNRAARENLRFARKTRLLDAPDLAWYEICSTWLPVNAWPWLASVAFWGALALLLCPNIFNWRRQSWHQALAAGLFALFLLTLPALLGVQTRSKIGVVLLRDTPLLLTPTRAGEKTARLAEGEIVRVERPRGRFVFVRASNASGWLEADQIGIISQLSQSLK